MPSLRDKLEGSDRFLVGVELVSTRGTMEEARAQRAVRFARDLAREPRVDWVSVTDNAGGHPMLAPAALGPATAVRAGLLRTTGLRVMRLLATVAAVAVAVVPVVMPVLSAAAARAERFIRASSSCASSTRTLHEPVPYIWRG
jgi:hypothetical protein